MEKIKRGLDSIFQFSELALLKGVRVTDDELSYQIRSKKEDLDAIAAVISLAFIRAASEDDAFKSDYEEYLKKPVPGWVAILLRKYRYVLGYVVDELNRLRKKTRAASKATPKVGSKVVRQEKIKELEKVEATKVEEPIESKLGADITDFTGEDIAKLIERFPETSEELYDSSAIFEDEFKKYNTLEYKDGKLVYNKDAKESERKKFGNNKELQFIALLSGLAKMNKLPNTKPSELSENEMTTLHKKLKTEVYKNYPLIQQPAPEQPKLQIYNINPKFLKNLDIVKMLLLENDIATLKLETVPESKMKELNAKLKNTELDPASVQRLEDNLLIRAVKAYNKKYQDGSKFLPSGPNNTTFKAILERALKANIDLPLEDDIINVNTLSDISINMPVTPGPSVEHVHAVASSSAGIPPVQTVSLSNPNELAEINAAANPVELSVVQTETAAPAAVVSFPPELEQRLTVFFNADLAPQSINNTIYGEQIAYTPLGEINKQLQSLVDVAKTNPMYMKMLKQQERNSNLLTQQLYNSANYYDPNTFLPNFETAFLSGRIENEMFREGRIQKQFMPFN